MWKKELSDHQKRLHTVKPTLPGPAAPTSGRPLTQSGRRFAGSSSTKGRLPSPETKRVEAAGGAAQGAQAAAPKGLKIEELPTSDQQTCEAMMSVLQKLNTADAKSILEELFVGCEMKRLLSQYTGVYPQPDAGEGSDVATSAAATSAGEPAPTGDRSDASQQPMDDSQSSPLASAASPQGKPPKRQQTPPTSAPIKSHNSTINSSYSYAASDTSSAAPNVADGSPRKASGASVASASSPVRGGEEEYGNESFE